MFRFSIGVLFLFTIINYYRTPFIFFIEDEWYGFGELISKGLGLLSHRYEIGDVNHLVPLNNVLSYLLFFNLKLNYVPYNILGLIIHFVNSILIYFICRKVIGNNFFTTLASVIFLTSSSAAEIVMWPMVSINTLSLSFALVAILTILSFKKKHNSLIYGLIVGGFSLMAFLLIEYSASLIIFIPILIFFRLLRNLKLPILRLVIFLSSFSLFTFMYLIFRFQALLAGKLSNAPHAEFTLDYFKIIEFPIRALSQIFLSERPAILVGELLKKITYFQTVDVLKLIYYISWIEGLIFFVGSLYLLYILIKNNRIQDLIVIGLILFFIFTSTLPFVFVPDSDRNFSTFPSRYLYFGIAGGAVLLAYLTTMVFNIKKRNLKIIMTVLIFLIISNGIYGNLLRQNRLAKDGETREKILTTIKEDNPILSQKVIFYTESDKSFYGLSDKDRILPFQSGFGQTLLVWYQDSEKFPKDFFGNRFLWEIKDQGYKEFENRGFGYYRDFEEMGRTIKDHKLSDENVVAYNYDSNTHKLIDITKQLQGQVQGYLAKKQALNLKNTSASASANHKDTNLVIDNDETTFWDSKLAYENPQYFEIDLGDSYEIAQLDINSGENKDQNEVGYSVFLSSDKKTWEEVFYSKRHPPGNEGVVRLYFKPTNARFIKIEQKGSHFFASWVINELMVYEATD